MDSRIDLTEVLEGLLRVTERDAQNGITAKDSYWRWPQRDQAGNTIDFFVQALGMIFHDAMRQITDT